MKMAQRALSYCEPAILRIYLKKGFSDSFYFRRETEKVRAYSFLCFKSIHLRRHMEMCCFLTPSGSTADTVRTSVASGKLSETVWLYCEGSNVGLVGFLFTVNVTYSVILFCGYALSYTSICS